MGRYLSPRYGQEILVRGYPVLTVVNGLFDDEAVILRHKALWAVQKTKQKQRWRRLDIEEGDLKLGLFHILADTSKIAELRLVQTEEERIS